MHARFTPLQRKLVAARAERLTRAHAGNLPDFLPPSEATTAQWHIAGDMELAANMPNSGAPGVRLDLEDSMANTWEHLMIGHRSVVAALHGESGHSDTVVWTRVRGLHLSQAGVISHTPASASLFDLALLVYSLDYERLRHPLCIYIPKSESADEALWWRDVFDALLEARGWKPGSLRAMALVESHPLAYQMEEFLFNLREYVIGISFGRWDYMASLIHYTFADPSWVLPDRNTIPFDVPFFARVRALMPKVTRKHGAMAIGGITAQLEDPHHDLRPVPLGVGTTTVEGTRAAVRTVIRYRNGLLEGRGTSLLDGTMEDLATDRVNRLMIAQRMRHPGAYTPASLSGMFDEELARILHALDDRSEATKARYVRAREISEQMIVSRAFDPS